MKRVSLNSIRGSCCDFCYWGKINGRDCLFLIDSGSEISVFSRKLLQDGDERICVRNFRFKYLTGEEVPVELKINAKIHIG